MNIKHSKEEIIKTGMYLFRLNGYHHTGTSEIITKAGISRGSFYNFFRDKEDFGIQALDYYTKWSTDYMLELLTNPKQNPLERIQTMFTEFVNGYKDVNYKWGCLLVGMTQELGGVSEAFNQVTQQNFERMLVPITTCIEAGQQEGQIRTDLKARELAIYSLSAYNGALIMMKSGMHDEPLDIFLFNVINYLKK